jgi:uncharacterized protein YndB with AHSA1/START domain
VPTVTRSRTVAAAPEEVWRLVTDPGRLPAWWPQVQRVEEASPTAWTKVLRSPEGKAIRADYTRVEARPPSRLVWRHEVAGSPFERILADSLVELDLAPAGAGAAGGGRAGPDGGGTRVSITLRHRTRGFARFGFFQVRLAAQRQLDEALDGLERLLGAA